MPVGAGQAAFAFDLFRLSLGSLRCDIIFPMNDRRRTNDGNTEKSIIVNTAGMEDH
ncbi:hypothetical protein ACQCVP_08785 [Rossellomorea vietnamensis]